MSASIYSHSLRGVLVLTALAAVGIASAASIQFPITSYSNFTDWSVSRSVSQFDPSLGKLLSVDFSLTGTMTTQMKLSNMSSQSTSDISGTVYANYSIVAASGGSSYLNGQLSVTKSDTNFGLNPNHSLDFANPYGRTYDNLTSTSTFTNSSTNAAVLSSFTGKGSIDLLIRALGDSISTSSNGNSYIDYTTTAGALGFVRYNYQPVPEPASFAALGLGVAAFARRRKGAKR